jgi:hypothetical protein
VPPAPTDKDRPKRKRAKRPWVLPKSYRTERAAPQRRAPAPRKGPPSPQRTGRTTDRNPPIPSKPRPRPSGPSAFEPFRSSHGLAREESKARAKTRRARSKLPADPRIPHFPVKKNYTRREKALIRLGYREAQKRTGVARPRDLYLLGNQDQRRNMRNVTHSILGGIEQVQQDRLEREQRTYRSPGPKPSLPKKLAQAGLFALGKPGQPLGAPIAEALGKTALNVGRATIEDPGDVASTSLRTARESITGIPQGIKAMADDPIKAITMIVEDYEHRYGDVLKDPEAFRERVKDEWGLTPYVLDAAAAAGGGGQALGALARTGAVGRAAAAFERMGAPGARAVRRTGEVLQSERPALRFSGGEEGVRPQARSRNLFVGLGQEALDRSRGKALTQRRDLERVRALDVEVKPGEVTPKTTGFLGRSMREAKPVRTFTGRVARDMGGQQSVGRVRLLTHQGRVVNRMRNRIGKLNDQEKLAVREMGELGVRSGPAGIAALRRRLGELEEAGHVDSPDAEAIRTILADPDAHITPRAGEIVDELREIQKETSAKDPRLPTATELLRRLGPQARLLGVERGPNVKRFRAKLQEIEADTGVQGLAKYADELAKALPEERPAIAKRMVKEIRKQRKLAEQRVETDRRRLAVAEEKARSDTQGPIYFRGGNPGEKPKDTGFPEWDRNLFMSHDEDIARLYGDTIEKIMVKPDAKIIESGTPEFEALRKRAGAGPMQAVKIAEQARREGVDIVDFKRSEVGAAVLNPDAVVRNVGDRATQAKVQRRQLDLATSRAARDHVRSFEKALRKVHKKTKGQARKFDPRLLEGHEEFAARISKAADEAGLAEPAYWTGILDGELADQPGAYAVGGGARATGKPKQTGYKLTESGRGERDPEVLVRGVESNIKRRFQYQLVARNIETHAFPWSRNNGRGMTIDEIRWYARENGIDPESIHIRDTRILTREGEADVPGDLQEDIYSDRMETRPLADVTSRDYSDLAQNRYLAMPAEVGETLNTSTRALDKQGWRMMEVVLKQKPARIMLGAANIPWLAFQMASNTLLTGLGGGLNPFDIYGAQKWFRGLDPEVRDAIEAELGITQGHHFAMDQPSLGATNSRMVNTWRGFKQTKAMRVGHRMNPLDAMFRVDEAQNNFFRKTLFYNKARKAAYRRMGSNWRGSSRGIERLTDRVLGKPPDRMAQAIAQHGPEFEQVAKHVKSFLGDYLSFSPAERFLLSRNVMFYGYLRFSLRFVFYTMPVGHPIMTALLSDIGRMGSQEIKDLFGVPRGYALPPSMLAQTYFGDRSDAKKGTLRSINFGRMNPFLNAVTQMEDGNQAVGLVSPLYQSVADQFFEESSFTGRDWRVRGQPTPSESERPRNYFTMEDRGRIALRQTLNLAFPYRVAEDLLLEPSQSDDALAWSPRPLKYKDEEAAAGVAKSRRSWEEEGTARHLGGALVPIFPKITAAPQVIKREREKEAAQDPKRKKSKRRRRSNAARYGGSSGSRYGG